MRWSPWLRPTTGFLWPPATLAPWAPTRGLACSSPGPCKPAREGGRERELPHPGRLPGSPAEQALAARFVSAYQAGDAEGLISLLTTDVLVPMPPVPLQYQGREAAASFFAAIFAGGRWAYELVPTMRANGQLAFGAYLHGGARPAVSLLVLELSGGQVSAVTGFESSWLPRFRLPLALPA
ncbi:MAG: nuclear transport factor 2 family protein [Candidatus Dormibacteria bacterium]